MKGTVWAWSRWRAHTSWRENKVGHEDALLSFLYCVRMCVESHDGETEQERYSRKRDPSDSTEELKGERESQRQGDSTEE